MSPAPARGLAGTPAYLVTGVDELATAGATMGLQWDLPEAVVVSHRIDVAGQQLHRVISDVTGVLERESLDLAHACVSCAIREDIVPTLRRLAELDRWRAIIAHLPLSAEALQVCRAIGLDGDDGDGPAVRVAAVVAALDGPSLVGTLTGDALLAEVGRHTSDGDRRGLAETAGAIVEYADVVTVHGEADDEALDLVRTLARPGAAVVADGEAVPPALLVGGLHDHRETEAWVSETRSVPLPPTASPAVWRLDLCSNRPFHPDRLHEHLAQIGGGPHRSRGCFWLPTRPGQACGWDGAGGQVSIGALGTWGRARVQTRLVVTGLCSLTSEAERETIRAAFEACLLTDAELGPQGPSWNRLTDGFEPWLGDVRFAA